MSTVLIIPTPPSANKLFTNVPGKGRVKSAKYRNWQTEVGWYVKIQKPQRVAGPYALAIQVPAKSKMDLDNHCKAIVDLLVYADVTDDDKNLRRLSICRDETTTEIIVTVEAA